MGEVGVVGTGVRDEEQGLLLQLPCSDLLLPARLTLLHGLGMELFLSTGISKCGVALGGGSNWRVMNSVVPRCNWS